MRKSTAEIIREKLAGLPPVTRCVEKSYATVSMLTVSPWGVGKWLLPWSRLESICLVPPGKEGGERLEMEFFRHHVLASGENLAGLHDDLYEGKVWLLRDLPPSHRAGLGPDEPFISRLEVMSLEEVQKRQAARGNGVRV